MNFIEHIIEPTKLFLAWHTLDETRRTRYIVAELNRMGDEITLSYLPNTESFTKAQINGFEPYTAFPDISKTYHNVLGAFMRRLPPRKREDFKNYLEGLRLKPDVKITDFALLGYSGAKLLSDGFSIIHPFIGVDGPCEILLEAAGYRHISSKPDIKIGDVASFVKEYNEPAQEEAIRIEVNKNHIDYVNRGLRPAFFEWMRDNRITDACIEKINGTRERPVVCLFVKVAAKN